MNLNLNLKSLYTLHKRPSSLLGKNWRLVDSGSYNDKLRAYLYLWLPKIDVCYLDCSILDSIKESRSLHSYFLEGNFGRYKIHVYLFYKNRTSRKITFDYLPTTQMDKVFEEGITSFLYQNNVINYKGIPLVEARISVLYSVPKPPYWLAALVVGSLSLVIAAVVQSLIDMHSYELNLLLI